MKLNKYEKIITYILAIIILCGTSSALKKYKNFKQFKQLTIITHITEEHKLPQNITKFSKKYKAYENIYSSDKPVFIYGYDSHSMNKTDGLIFHNELTQKLANEKINYQILSFKNWENINDELREKYDPQSEGCTMESSEQADLNKLLKITSSCLMNSCIVDPKTQKYYFISRDTDYIKSILKESYPPTADVVQDEED